MSLKVLFIGQYDVSLNISIAELELICGLSQKPDITIDVYAPFNTESLRLLNDSGVDTITGKLPEGFDLQFVETIKKIQADHKYDIIHCYHSRILRHVIFAIKRTPVKLVTYLGAMSVHWHDPTAYFSFLHPRVDAVICNSKRVLTHFKKQFFGKSKTKAHLIYKGYSTAWFDDVTAIDRVSLNIPDKALMVTLAGTYSKVKGIEYFIKSQQYLPKDLSVFYVIMGHGTDSKTLKDLVLQMPFPDRIQLLGYREDAKRIVKASDIYAQTSLKEGFGRSLSEAVSMAKPVIITRTVGFSEVIEPEVSGLVIPPKQPRAIADAIVKLKNETFRQQMGSKAKTYFEQHFNSQNTIDKTYQLYQNLINE